LPAVMSWKRKKKVRNHAVIERHGGERSEGREETPLDPQPSPRRKALNDRISVGQGRKGKLKTILRDPSEKRGSR